MSGGAQSEALCDCGTSCGAREITPVVRRGLSPLPDLWPLSTPAKCQRLIDRFQNAIRVYINENPGSEIIALPVRVGASRGTGAEIFWACHRCAGLLW